MKHQKYDTRSNRVINFENLKKIYSKHGVGGGIEIFSSLLYFLKQLSGNSVNNCDKNLEAESAQNLNIIQDHIWFDK